LRRPILVAIGVPGLLFIVLRDRIGDAMPFQRGLHVGGGSLERKFRCVDAHHDKAAVFVFRIQFGDVRQRVDAIDTAIVQKSTSTTLPRSSAMLSGAELNQC